MAKQDFEINKRIIQCRRQRFLNQTQVAQFLGIKTSTYSQMERQGIITAVTLRSLSELFEVDPYYLLYGTEHTKNALNIAAIVNDAIKETEKKYKDRYGFLENVSKIELGHLENTLFHLSRTKRNEIYEYAYKILTKKKQTST